MTIRSERHCSASVRAVNPDLDLHEAFEHVKVVYLQAGETLVQSDTPSAFVYFPLGEGLRGLPLGGYGSFSVAAWMPLGNTGVIRGAARNADVVAERDLYLLVIPKDVYLRHWYAPYSPEELKKLLGRQCSKQWSKTER
jgi:hypothetical protein